MYIDSKLSQTFSKLLQRSYTSSRQRRIVALALGSNVGDRVANIEGALSYLERKSDVRIVDTSFLYETAPMYVVDQPNFINGACLVRQQSFFLHFI
jgi:dihydroneopterin aldolase/2-amino-4-hydroxy-6-hydroxymethyldihydropteridine diphosphokinase/dihydropteroate synthase